MKGSGRKKTSSGRYAKDRMELLLVSERIDCSPQMINMMKNDLIHTMSKYVNIDREAATLRIYGEPPVIQAILPVHRKKE